MDTHSENWCRQLYDKSAPGLILYGRSLGLSHAESENLVQETILGLLRLPQRPVEARRYCFRAFRNRALNYRRGWFRRLARELEA